MTIYNFLASQSFPSVCRLVLSAFVCYIIQLIFVSVYRLTWHPLAKYPGPFLAKITSWYGFYHGIRGDFHIDALRAHHKYGNIIRYGPNRLLANHEASFRGIYDYKKNVKKTKAYLVAPGPTSIFSSVDRDIHYNRRKLIAGGLSDSAIKGFEPAMLVHVRILCKKILEGSDPWEWSSARNMIEFCHWLAFEIMTEFTLGTTFKTLTDQLQRYIIDAIASLNIMTGAYTQFPEFASFRVERLLGYRFQREGEKILAITREYVNKRIAIGNDDRKNLLDSIMQHQEPEAAQQLSLADLLAESVHLILAGSNPTSTTLTACFFYLVHSPNAYCKVAQEVRKSFNSLEEIRTGQSLRSCRYLHACIYETLRMSPPVSWPMWREVGPGGLHLNGDHIPAGCDVGVSMYALYHNETVFKDSFTFAPERWLGEYSDRGFGSKAALAGTCNSFSIGPSSCLGRTIAMMELTTTLAMVFFLADFRVAPGNLGSLGAGSLAAGDGRRREKEFQLRACLTSISEGPMLQFKPRA